RATRSQLQPQHLPMPPEQRSTDQTAEPSSVLQAWSMPDTASVPERLRRSATWTPPPYRLAVTLRADRRPSRYWSEAVNRLEQWQRHAHRLCGPRPFELGCQQSPVISLG